MADDTYYVEIRDRETDTLQKRKGPYNERKAERILSGTSRGLNHERFYLVFVDDEEGQPPSTPRRLVKLLNGLPGEWTGRDGHRSDMLAHINTYGLDVLQHKVPPAWIVTFHLHDQSIIGLEKGEWIDEWKVIYQSR